MSKGTIYTFKDKSEKSFESGECLKTNGYYNSSIHCFYYSCIQMTNHFFISKLKLTDSDIRDMFKTEASHNKTLELIIENIGKSKRRIITNNFNDLKQKRVQADYREFYLSESDSIECKEWAEEYLNTIKIAL